MKPILYEYEVFPMVFPIEKPVLLTIKPLGVHRAFNGEYKIVVHRMNAGSAGQPFTAWNQTEFLCTPDADGCLRFTYTAESESEYFIRIYQNDRRIAQLSVYALEHDLAERMPLRGDLHMHTFRSDGRESPAVVCANYRKRGYDFIVITDHERYYPSLEAISAYAGTKIPMTILPGEEVHLPGTDVHIVNACGLFSVNGLLPVKCNYVETDGALECRRADATVIPPDVLTMEQYEKEIDAIESALMNSETPFPENVNRRWYAVCLWGFEKIREADGLGIFAHPYWISDLWQISEPFTRYMMEQHPFDAFEVLGGENYYHQNGLQTALYYDEFCKGRVHPIVGSTDSHGSTEHNRNADVCSTIVFAKANERKAIVEAVKDRYSVAVDTISKEYRLVGEYRLQKYAAFLMENYFPIHDRQAAMDGEMMYQYSVDNADAAELEPLTQRSQKLIRKYICLA